VSRTNVLSNGIPREPVHSTLEIDAHADTCVLGPNLVILYYTGRECDVSPYTEVYESFEVVPIVSGARAWTDVETGLTYILVIDPPRVDHLDVVGRLTPSNNGNQEFTNAPT
jgi:hypothetical protein